MTTEDIKIDLNRMILAGNLRRHFFELSNFSVACFTILLKARFKVKLVVFCLENKWKIVLDKVAQGA